MSRPGAADIVTRKPQPNIYTVLVVVAFLAQLLALMVIYFSFQTAFGGSIFSA